LLKALKALWLAKEPLEDTILLSRLALRLQKRPFKGMAKFLAKPAILLLASLFDRHRYKAAACAISLAR
jgi:hypothetical protein